MKLASLISSIFISVVLLAAQDGFCLDRFGLIYDIDGQCTIRGADGKTETLDKNKHILRPVKEGDVIDVSNGKVIVVAEKDGKSYEIRSKTSVRVKDEKMVAIKGEIQVKEGSRLPKSGTSSQMAGKPIGAIVLRGSKPCVTAQSPINTAILELTPEMKWKNQCEGLRKVNVKILTGETVLYSADTEVTTIRVPEGVLAYGREYRWMVDGGSYGISGGIFSIHDSLVVAQIRQQLESMKQDGDGMYQRMTRVFYLFGKGLNQMAQEEIDVLTKEYPDNTYIKQLAEKGTLENK